MTRNIPKVTTAETTESLKYFVGLSMAYAVNDDGWVVDADDDTAVHKIKGSNATDPSRGIVVYSETMPQPVNYYILNPYAEGLGLSTPSNTFFYSSLRTAAFARLKMAICGVVRFIQAQKGLKFEDSSYQVIGTPRCLLDAANGFDKKKKPIIDLVDDKTFDHIDHFLNNKKNRKDYIYIGYSKNQMKASLNCDILTQPDYADMNDLGRMRKVDLEVLKVITGRLLRLKNISDLEEYVCESDDDAPNKMSAWLKVLFKLYKAINPVLHAINDGLGINLDTFKYHLDRLSGYTANARWMVQSNNETVPAAVPQMNTGASSIPAPVGYPQQAGAGLVPGPIRNDGTVMPPQPVNPWMTMQPQTQMPIYQPPMQPNNGVPAPMYVQPNYGQPQPQMGYPQAMYNAGPQFGFAGGPVPMPIPVQQYVQQPNYGIPGAPPGVY
mgnify:CR=1 FL=1